MIGKNKYIWRNIGEDRIKLCSVKITGCIDGNVYEYTENKVIDGIVRVGLAYAEQLFNTKEEAQIYLGKGR